MTGSRQPRRVFTWMIVFAVGVLLAAVLVSCSSNDETDNQPAATEATESAEESPTPQTRGPITVIDPWVRATIPQMPSERVEEEGTAESTAESGVEAVPTEAATAPATESATAEATEVASEELATMEPTTVEMGTQEAPGGTDTGLTTAAYMTIENTGDTPLRLVAVDSDLAGAVEIHETTLEGDVMKMQPIDGLDIPANSSVELKPGGTHIMLMNVATPLVPGDLVGMTLTFADGQEITIEAPVFAVDQ